MEPSPQKKKILYVITKSNWGGAQRYVFDLATSLPKDRYEVKVALGGNGQLAERLRENGVTVLSIKKLERDVRALKDLFVLWALFRVFKKEKPDIVHLNSSKIGGLGALAARLAGVKNILFTVHGFAFKEDRAAIARLFIKFLTWLTLVFTTKNIFVTRRELVETNGWALMGNKNILIHNGISSPRYLSREEARKKILGFLGIDEVPPDTLLIGTIGELTRNKGYGYALDAMVDCPRSFLAIIGEGEEKTDLLSKLAAKGLGSKVFLVGFIPEAYALITAFDIFLISSVKEGFP
ncbi:MAG: glycosyltransferase, partial [bacterium]|nr:glycosyltransferase [bacterium]